MKVMKNARETYTNGPVKHEEIEMATYGVEVNDDGRVVSESPSGQNVVNGNGKGSVNGDETRHSKE